jgi:hypothetical protein
MFVDDLSSGSQSRGAIYPISLVQPKLQPTYSCASVFHVKTDEELVVIAGAIPMVSLTGAATVSFNPALGVDLANQLS